MIKRIKTEGKEQQQQHAPDAATSQPGFGYGSPVVQAFPVASAGGFSQQPPQFLPQQAPMTPPQQQHAGLVLQQQQQGQQQRGALRHQVLLNNLF